MSEMHSHDPDLIAALAEGSLDREAAATAEAEVAACLRCSSDLQAHQTALRVIADAAPARLSPSEAEALRIAVASTIDIAPVAAPEPQPARRVSWGALGIAAAALVGIVAVVPVLGLLSTGGDDATDATFSVAADAAPDSDDTAATSRDMLESESPAPAAVEEFADTTEAAAGTTAAPTTTAPAAEALEAYAPIQGAAGLDEILADDSIAEYYEPEPTSPMPCSEEAMTDLGPAAVGLRMPLIMADGTELIVYVEPDSEQVAGYQATDCALRLTRP
jgi:hypothetical protein